MRKEAHTSTETNLIGSTPVPIDTLNLLESNNHKILNITNIHDCSATSWMFSTCRSQNLGQLIAS